MLIVQHCFEWVKGTPYLFGLRRMKRKYQNTLESAVPSKDLPELTSCMVSLSIVSIFVEIKGLLALFL